MRIIASLGRPSVRQLARHALHGCSSLLRSPLPVAQNNPQRVPPVSCVPDAARNTPILLLPFYATLGGSNALLLGDAVGSSALPQLSGGSQGGGHVDSVLEPSCGLPSNLLVFYGFHDFSRTIPIPRSPLRMQSWMR